MARPVKAPNGWTRAFSHIEVAPILTVDSGHPINVVTGGDDNQTGAFPFTSRPLNVGRNSSRLPASATLDIRVLKYFNIKPHGKLDLVIEAFNLLNRTNVNELNTVYGPLSRPCDPSAGRSRPGPPGSSNFPSISSSREAMERPSRIPMRGRTRRASQ